MITKKQNKFFQLDSATSLIQAAKNLMNAVVLAVKASYVASTKYSKHGANVSPQIYHNCVLGMTLNSSVVVQGMTVKLRPCLRFRACG